MQTNGGTLLGSDAGVAPNLVRWGCMVSSTWKLTFSCAGQIPHLEPNSKITFEINLQHNPNLSDKISNSPKIIFGSPQSDPNPKYYLQLYL